METYRLAVFVVTYAGRELVVGPEVFGEIHGIIRDGE